MSVESDTEEPVVDKTAENEARKERLADEAIVRIRSGSHWLDWMMVGDWLAIGQDKAMRASGMNRPYGKGYQKAFGIWLKEHPAMDAIDSGTRSHLLWAVEHRSEIEVWRQDKLKPDDREKLNHPTAVKRKYEAQYAVSKDPDAPKKETKAVALQTENANLWEKVGNLEQRIKNGQGSLFNLQTDTASDIAKVILNYLGDDKIRELSKVLLAGVKARRAKVAHAG